MNLIQLERNGMRAVARIEGDQAITLRGVTRMNELAQRAIRGGMRIDEAVEDLGDAENHSYPALLAAGDVVVPIDHPDPAHCFITGTGLTHLGSAAARDEMHRKADAATGNETDSIKMDPIIVFDAMHAPRLQAARRDGRLVAHRRRLVNDFPPLFFEVVPVFSLAV